jgi:hypothetical protein
MEVLMFESKDFRGRKPAILTYFKKNGVTSDSIAEYCTLAGIPITVVCEFIIEDMPEHSEMCRAKIREIKKFFGIKE